MGRLSRGIFSDTSSQLATGVESLCYAESEDGIHWHKPDLGLCEFQGSKANNIVFSSAMADGFSVNIRGPAVFKDENPNAPLDARYKTFFTSRNPLGMRPFQFRGQ